MQGPQVGCSRLEIPTAATGAESAITTTTATLAGSVTPNGRATGRRFAYGTSTAYGSTTPEQAAGAGDAAVPASVPISGLAPSTTYHFRVEAIREGGVLAVAGDDATFTTPAAVPPPPPAAGDTTPPSFLGTLTAALGTKLKGKRKVTFRFGLSEAASVRVVLTRDAKGGRSKGKCLSPKAGRPMCTRQLAIASSTRALKPAGTTRLAFALAKRLGKGAYTAKLTATDDAGNRSQPKSVRFKVR